MNLDMWHGLEAKRLCLERDLVHLKSEMEAAFATILSQALQLGIWFIHPIDGSSLELKPFDAEAEDQIKSLVQIVSEPFSFPYMQGLLHGHVLEGDFYLMYTPNVPVGCFRTAVGLRRMGVHIEVHGLFKVQKKSKWRFRYPHKHRKTPDYRSLS